jgi:PhnO protein
MNFTTRQISPNDFEAIYFLISDLTGHDMDKTMTRAVFLKNLSDPNIHYLVAEKETKIVGFISLHVQTLLHHNNPTGEIQELIILPEYRGAGVGGILMNEMEEIAHSLNLEEIELTTRITREKAQYFYRKIGYNHTHNKFVKKL